MTGLFANVRQCESGQGWCVEADNRTYGPMEDETEARSYAQLLSLVHSARTQIACIDEVCWQ